MIDPEVILQSRNLPTLPSIAVQLLELSNNPEAQISDYVSVIRNDPAISARIVQAANSSYFGMSFEATSVEGAIPRLGTTVVTSLALSFSLVMDSHDKQHNDLYTDLWSRSLLQAVAGEFLAKKYRKNPPCQFFLAGLLCDIGVLALLKTIPDEYVPLLHNALETGSAVDEAERQELGFSHAEIAARMMEQWHMPEMLIKAVSVHHAPLEDFEALEDGEHPAMCRFTRFASCLGEYLTRNGDMEVFKELCEFGQSFFDIDEEELKELIEEVRDKTEDAAQMMSIDTAKLPKPSELLAEANAQLAQIALREHAAMAHVSAQRAELEIKNQQLAETNTKLHEQTGRDGLTGVNNRWSFDQIFERMIAECIGLGGPAAIIFADVDRFKSLNDTYGHSFGDKVLQRVADLLRESVRTSDFVARYGGEEFVVVAVDCAPDVVSSIAERIRSRVEEEIFECEGKRVPVTISVGGCAVKPCDRVADENMGIAREMLQAADAAMYHCKRNGRNLTHIHVCEHMDAVRNDIAT